jgi:dTDP-4-dehydrorhamnose reductase
MPSTELDRPAPRPRNSVLRNLALELTVGDPMPEWEESLRDYLEGRG